MAALEASLKEGLTPDEATLHFARSSLGLVSDAETAEAIESEEFPALTGLLLFPEEPLALLIEPMIPKEGTGPGSEEAIVEYISGRVCKIPVIIPDSGLKCSIVIERIKTAQFIKRLHLEKAVPFDLPDQAPLDKAARLLVKGRLMIRRRKITASGYEECARLTEKLAAVTEDEGLFSGAMDMALELLESGNEGLSLFHLLNMERKKWMDILIKNRDFQEMYSRYSMDILMSLRVSPPAEGTERAARAISLTEHILKALYGFIPPVIQNETNRTLDITKLDEDTMAEIISIL